MNIMQAENAILQSMLDPLLGAFWPQHPPRSQPPACPTFEEFGSQVGGPLNLVCSYDADRLGAYCRKPGSSVLRRGEGEVVSVICRVGVTWVNGREERADEHWAMVNCREDIKFNIHVTYTWLRRVIGC